MSKPGTGMTPLSEIQLIVNELSDKLHRSIAVDDQHLELVCASAQHGPIDKWRVDAIITRTVPQATLPWLDAHGIQTSRKPVRLPYNDELEMLARVCFPIRRDASLLGYLWLFDEPRVSDEDMATASAAVDLLVPLLGSDDHVVRDRVEDLQRLLSRATQASSSIEAVQEAVQLGYLDGRAGFHVHVMSLRQPKHRNRITSTDGKGLQFELARRQLGLAFLTHVEDDVLVTVSNHVSARDSRDFEATLVRAAEAVGLELASGGSATAAAPTDLETALGHARFAAELSALHPGRASTMAWEDLGSWRLLHGRSLSPQTVVEISPEAETLLSEGTPQHWQTALAYLDSGRRVPVACEQLTIHRATLYYRLDRVRELIGADALDDGWRSTSLHLALKLHGLLVQTR